MNLTLNKRLRIALLCSLIVILAFAGLFVTRKLVDFPIYHLAGQSLLHGRTDLYAPEYSGGALMDYRYPPFFLIALTPLWLLPYKAAAYVWYILCLLEICVCVWAVQKTLARARHINERAAKQLKIVWMISLLAVGQYYIMILHYGNAHLLAICLLFGAFYFALRGKRTLSALLMALSITIKLTPLLALPYFAVKKQWTLLMLTALFLVILNLAPGLYFGFGKNAQLLDMWYAQVVAGEQYQEYHEINGPVNLSLKGQLRRYLTQVDYSQRYGGDSRYSAINFASLSAQQVNRLWKSLVAALYLSCLGAIWWTTRRDARILESKNEDDATSYRTFGVAGWRAMLEIGVMICLMLITSPTTSKIYFIALLWPVAGLANFALTSRSLTAKACQIALIFIAAANLLLPLLPGSATQRMLLVIGTDFYVCLLLLVLHIAALTLNRRDERTSAA